MEGAHDFRFGSFRLDLQNERLWRGPEVIRLRPKSFAVLRYLVVHPGRVVTKDELLQAVWPDTAVSEAALTVCLNELRRALGETAQAPQYIATVHRRGYRFLAPVTQVASTEPLMPPTPAPPVLSPSPTPLLVGREAACARLSAWLAQARCGRRQVGFVTGEAGLGKTTVVDAFLGQVASDPSLWLARGQCIEHYGAGEAYLPVLEVLGQLCHGPDGMRLVAGLTQHAPTWLVQMPALLSATALEAVQQRVQGATRERMLREFAEALEVLTAAQPLVLVLEDLHWSDAATLDLVGYLARRRAPAQLLLLGTYRPVEVLVRAHPLRALTLDLALHRQCVELPLESLSATDIAQYLAARFGEGALPSALALALHRRTDGHPLFLVTVVDTLVQQGLVREVGGQWAVTGDLTAVEEMVPESLRALIAQQFDRLPPADQGVLEAASVAGLESTVSALAAGIEAEVEVVEAQCAALAQRGLFLQAHGVEEWPDGTVTARYGFRHTLYQQVVYERLPVGRRMRLHRQIGARLEAGYGSQAGERAAELAMHCERGRDYARAPQYLHQAAQNVLRRAAFQEALRHLTRGLELLKTLPATPERAKQEIVLQTTLGSVLIAVKGQTSPEVEQVYSRARELCQQVGETPQLVSALFGLWRFYNTRPQLHTARELGETLLHLAQRAYDPALSVIAHYVLGVTRLWLGALPAAHRHLEEGIAHYTPDQRQALVFHMGQDPGVGCRGNDAWALWLLGYPEQALARVHEALRLAHELAHPFSLAFAQSTAAFVSQFRRDVLAVHEHAEAAVALATTQAFPFWVAQGTSLRGWGLAMQGEGEEGVAQICQGVAAWQATGAAMHVPYFCTLLAEAYDHLGRPEDALQALAEAHTLVEQHEDRWWEAEVYRLRGVLLLRQTFPAQQTVTQQAEAETWLQRALDVARRQQAKSLELRAALSLSRLWQRQGKREEAGELLASIYGWFTEGFDTADLREAKALLDELGA